MPKTRSLGKTYMGFKERSGSCSKRWEHAKSSVLLAFSSLPSVRISLQIQSPRAVLIISHHSILRDARREDSLREQFANQDERLGSLERVVASGNLTLLERIKAPESQQLVEAAKPIEPRRLALALNDSKRHRTFDEQRKTDIIRYASSGCPYLCGSSIASGSSGFVKRRVAGLLNSTRS